MVENLDILKIFEKSSNLQIKEYLRFVPHFYSGWGMGLVANSFGYFW